MGLLINIGVMTMTQKKTPQKTIKEPRSYDSVIGMLQIFVLVSIAYSTYIVALGTHGYAPKIMLIPQALWAAILLVRRFTSTK